MIHQSNGIGFPAGGSYIRPASAGPSFDKSLEAQEQGLPIDGLGERVEDDAFDFLTKWVTQEPDLGEPANLPQQPKEEAPVAPKPAEAKSQPTVPVTMTMTAFDHTSLLG